MVPCPGIEPGSLRPQRNVITTIPSQLLVMDKKQSKSVRARIRVQDT